MNLLIIHDHPCFERKQIYKTKKIVYKINMAEFVSTFTTGFQNTVKKNLPKLIKEVKILNIFDGLVHYQFNGNSRDLEKIIYFNNTFFVIKTWKNPINNDINIFSNFVSDFCKEKKYFLINKGTFRVRFLKENQFIKIEKKLIQKVEENIIKNSRMKLNRVSPSTEIWFSKRSEGFCFCGQLISKREFTEKNLNKGELRPEIAYLICSFADIQKNDNILEPFCGYGSIPIQLVKKFHFNHLFASDIDENKILSLKENKIFKEKDFVDIYCEDAFVLENIQDKSIDKIITDPPWGFYEDVGDIRFFYDKMFNSFERILKSKESNVIILTARKNELDEVLKKHKYTIVEKINTLVNGKKAAVYKLHR